MAKLGWNWGAVLSVVFASGCAGNDPQVEVVGRDEQATQTSFDRPALAAFEYLAPTNFGQQGVPVLVACDDQNRLMYTYRHLINGWRSWTLIAAGCVGVPAVAKWRVDFHDSASIYARFDDNHLWEAWLPNIDNDMSTFIWTDLSVASGYGEIMDSPMLAASGTAWDVSLVVRNGTSYYKPLSTIDWHDGSWSHHKVIASGSTAISTANVVSTRGPLEADSTGYSYIAGRGLSNDTTAWFARRNGFTGSYARVSSRDVTSGVSGTPAPVLPVGIADTHPEIEHARFGSNVKSREGAGGWTSFSNCVPTGSPRIATMPWFGWGLMFGFVRGGATASTTNDLMILFGTGNGGTCVSVGGTINSGPTAIEYAVAPYNEQSAAYKGPGDQVYFYNAEDDVHEPVPGITLP